eukprot:2410380-Amphidinium_carterae.1
MVMMMMMMLMMMMMMMMMAPFRALAARLRILLSIRRKVSPVLACEILLVLRCTEEQVKPFCAVEERPLMDCFGTVPTWHVIRLIRQSLDTAQLMTGGCSRWVGPQRYRKRSLGEWESFEAIEMFTDDDELRPLGLAQQALLPPPPPQHQRRPSCTAQD